LAANKKTFVLRISEQAYAALARWADDEFRSVNGQIEMILDRALREAGRAGSDRPGQVGSDPPKAADADRDQA
jgi:hypothetical protein